MDGTVESQEYREKSNKRNDGYALFSRTIREQVKGAQNSTRVFTIPTPGGKKTVQLSNLPDRWGYVGNSATLSLIDTDKPIIAEDGSISYPSHSIKVTSVVEPSEFFTSGHYEAPVKKDPSTGQYEIIEPKYKNDEEKQAALEKLRSIDQDALFAQFQDILQSLPKSPKAITYVKNIAKRILPPRKK